MEKPTRPKNSDNSRVVWHLFVDGKLQQTFTQFPPKHVWDLRRLKGIEIKAEEVFD